MSTARLQPPVDLGRDHWRGSDGDVVELVQFGDYECPYSAKAFWNIQRVERELGAAMRFVFRQLPLTDLHPHALAAAGARVGFRLPPPPAARPPPARRGGGGLRGGGGPPGPLLGAAHRALPP